MIDAIRAKTLLHEANHTCVLCRGDVTHVSDRIGIAPMMEFLDAGLELRGFCAADRIVGKAAALLFVLAGVCAVYADVMSENALEVLNRNGIKASYNTLTPYIINRKGEGPCPMELAVRDIDDPEVARAAIRETLRNLRRSQEEDQHEKQ